MKLKNARKTKKFDFTKPDDLSPYAIFFLLTEGFCRKKVEIRVMKTVLIMLHYVNTMPNAPTSKRSVS